MEAEKYAVTIIEEFKELEKAGIPTELIGALDQFLRDNIVDLEMKIKLVSVLALNPNRMVRDLIVSETTANKGYWYDLVNDGVRDPRIKLQAAHALWYCAVSLGFDSVSKAASYQFSQGVLYLLTDLDVFDEEQSEDELRQLVSRELGSDEENPFIKFIEMHLTLSK